MPHSSGGGSHSGGSHSSSGSSHHSGSSGGGSSRGGSNHKVSSTPFTGSKRYVYYHDRVPSFVYSNYDIRKDAKWDIPGLILAIVLFVLPAFVVGIILLKFTIKTPQKLKVSRDYNPKIFVEDRLGIMEDEDELEDVLWDIYEETGIATSVLVVPNSEWKDDYSDFSKYAYQAYIDYFKHNEKHWLIVYSEEIKENGFNDWYWEGMQGYETDDILTEEKANKFNEALHKRLLQRDKYSVDEAIGLSLKELQPKLMKPNVDKKLLGAMGLVLGIWMLFVVPIIITTFKPKKSMEIYKNAVPCNLEIVMQEPCQFCGGIYISGLHKTCPHCGAALKTGA